MSAHNHKYNQDYHPDSEPFNNEPRPEWEKVTEQDRQRANDALDALIKKTKEGLKD